MNLYNNFWGRPASTPITWARPFPPLWCISTLFPYAVGTPSPVYRRYHHDISITPFKEWRIYFCIFAWFYSIWVSHWEMHTTLHPHYFATFSILVYIYGWYPTQSFSSLALACQFLRFKHFAVLITAVTKSFQFEQQYYWTLVRFYIENRNNILPLMAWIQSCKASKTFFVWLMTCSICRIHTRVIGFLLSEDNWQWSLKTK